MRFVVSEYEVCSYENGTLRIDWYEVSGRIMLTLSLLTFAVSLPAIVYRAFTGQFN